MASVAETLAARKKLEEEAAAQIAALPPEALADAELSPEDLTELEEKVALAPTKVVHLEAYEPKEGAYESLRIKVIARKDGTKFLPDSHGFFNPVTEEEIASLEYLAGLNRGLVIKA